MTRRKGAIRLGAVVEPHLVPRPVDFALVRETVRAAERAGVDAVVLADRLGGGQTGPFEATTLASALAATTDRIGLVVTAATTHHAPYHVARIVASLDHLSGGRAGWFATPDSFPAEAANFGDEHPAPEHERYARAAEFVDVVRGLWDSFEDGAFVHDRASGQYWRLDKLHRLDHSEKFFDVAGPLNVARPPQGHPVVAVPASPEQGAGTALATDFDLVFTDAGDLDQARRLYSEIRGAAEAEGAEADGAGPNGAGPDGPGTWSTAADGARVFAALPAGADADLVEEWYEREAADGFTVPVASPEDPFLTVTVPELRRRGRLADAGRPAGTTLRAALGLARPSGRHSR